MYCSFISFKIMRFNYKLATGRPNYSIFLIAEVRHLYQNVVIFFHRLAEMSIMLF
jgi:hypothetical protein